MDNKNEKVSFNISQIDLGKIDYLIENGFYGNRTEFIRAAIKRELNTSDKWLNNEFIAKQIEMGNVTINKSNLSLYDKPTNLIVIGKLTIDNDILLEDLKDVFKTIKIFGKKNIPNSIIDHYNL